MSELILIDPTDTGASGPETAASILADLHRSAFDRPWDAETFRTLIGQAGVFAVRTDAGFILCRCVADEAEVLTLAVAPAARRSGLGLRLTEAAVEMAARAGAISLFLEVAEDNDPARGLYGRAGFIAQGRRRGYYSHPDGRRTDALLLVLNLRERLPTG